MLEAMGRFGEIRTTDPAFAAAAAVAGQSNQLRRQLRPFADKTKLVSPVTYPATNDRVPAAPRRAWPR